jgi:hypothetical protein
VNNDDDDDETVVARRNSMLMVGVYLLRIPILVVGVPFGRSGRGSDREGEHATSVFCSSTCLNTIYLMKHSNTEKVVIDMFMVLESSNSKQSLDLEVNSGYPQGWVQ